MVGADDEWRSQHENGYTFTTPKDAPHHDGYCWIYAIVHKNQHDGLYVGRTTQSLECNGSKLRRERQQLAVAYAATL
eukprot:4134-Heterococcus_DN1.PRE.1